MLGIQSEFVRAIRDTILPNSRRLQGFRGGMMAENIWCVNLKSNKTSAQFCIDRGLVGIGWGLDPAPSSGKEYLQQGKSKYHK